MQPFLNQQKGENGHRNYCMIDLQGRMLPSPAGIKPATPDHPSDTLTELLRSVWVYGNYCSLIFERDTGENIFTWWIENPEFSTTDISRPAV